MASLRGRVVVPADAQQEVVVERALADEKVKSELAASNTVKTIFVPGKLLNFVVR